ncbi:MAG: Na+/H+ antiporter NhaC family protein [Lachnospiraceae bacterium]
MEEKKYSKNYGFLALMPIIVFLVLYVGIGIVFTILGAESPFWKMPRYVAMMIAILTGFFCYAHDMKLSEKVDVYCHGAGKPGIMQLGLILLLAGGFANSTAAIGGKESMVNLGISLVPTQFLVPGIFIICCIISTCIGTSMGTQVTMIPIAIALAQGAGLNPGMAGAAAIAGAYFGDNLSIISDTTIAATQGVGADMTDKFRMNFLIALPAAVITIVLYCIQSLNTTVVNTADVGSYNIITILPYIAVLVLAIAGLDVVLVLVLGTVLSCIIGMAAGTAGFFDWAQAVGAGMEDMFWLAVFAMMISGMVELVKFYGGIDYMLKAATNHIKSRKGCEYIIGLLSMFISGTTLNNTVAIIVSCPIAKELGGKYKIAPKRLASLLDIFGAAALMVVPHDSGCLLVQQYAEGAVNYLDIVRFAYYPFFLILFTCITVQFGLLRTKEEKEAVKAMAGK